MSEQGTRMEVMYTNYKGETSLRKFIFHRLYYGSTKYHPKNQWLVRGFDLDKNAFRDYAVKDMKGII